MPGSDSPLQIIKQRESDLRQQVEAARSQADARIRAARADAERMIKDADAAGRAAAAAEYQARIEKAHREAEAIVTGANEEAAALRRLAMSRLGDVARRIAELAYAPPNGEGPDHRSEAASG